MADPANPALLTLTAQISAAYLAGNMLDAAIVPGLVRDVYQALTRLEAPAQIHREPAVPVNRSVQHDYLVCLEDGAPVKTLKPYLRRFGLTPESYRAKWGLPTHYPMVAPALAAKRSELMRGNRQRQPPLTTPRNRTVAAGAEEGPLTAASVFANFPGAEPAVEVAATPGASPKPTRKRFAQQSMRQGARRAR